MTKRMNINRKHCKPIPRIATALAGLIVALSLAATTQAHDVHAHVKEQYKFQKRDLLALHVEQNKAIRVAYTDAIRHINLDRRAAVKFCEPLRTDALRRLSDARKQAGECYRNDLLRSNKEYRLRVAELEAWYVSARQTAKYHSHTVAVVPTRIVSVSPTYVVNRTTTYTTVPSRVTQVVPHEIHTEVIPSPPPPVTEFGNSGYELIEPEVSVESSFEGPVTEGLILHGPVIEGPVYSEPEPTPAVRPSAQ